MERTLRPATPPIVAARCAVSAPTIRPPRNSPCAMGSAAPAPRTRTAARGTTVWTASASPRARTRASVSASPRVLPAALTSPSGTAAVSATAIVRWPAPSATSPPASAPVEEAFAKKERFVKTKYAAGRDPVLDFGSERRLRVHYVVFGVLMNSGLATALGASCDEDGYLHLGRHHETSVPGLYAAGDVVQPLPQISVAFGQARIAASGNNATLRCEARGLPKPKWVLTYDYVPRAHR